MREFPHSRASEAAVLGILIGRPELFTETAHRLSAESFYVAAHRLIFDTLRELHAEAKAVDGQIVGVDALILRQRLVDKGQLDSIGGFDYLQQVCRAGPDEANFEYYLRIVMEKAERRQFIMAAENAADAARSNDRNLDEIRADARKVVCGTASQGRTQAQSAAGVAELIAGAVQGKLRAIPTPWSGLDKAARALLPGSVTLLCGGLGASKSFMLLQLVASVMDIKSAVYELEESREYHLMRALAQRSGLARLTDSEWIRENAQAAQDAYEEHEDFLDRFSQRVWASGCQPTLPQIAAWVEDRAREGCKLIAVDPITAAAHTGRDMWQEDNDFLQRVKGIAVEQRVTLLLVTHPVKGIVKSPDVNLLAGSAAYARFAQCILWLENHAANESMVRTDCGRTSIEHNRTVHVLKARNGPGQGARLACLFDAANLTLRECGIILKKGT